MKIIELMLISVVLTYGDFIQETHHEYILINESMKIHISKESNTISAIICGNTNILSANADITVTKPEQHVQGKFTKAKITKCYSDSAVLVINQEFSDYVAEYTFVIDHDALKWEVEVLQKKNIEEEISIAISIPLVRKMSHFFYPSSDSIYSTSNIEPQVRTYRKSLFLPLYCFYDTTTNAGLTVVTPFDTPKPGLVFSVDQRRFTVTYTNMLLRNGTPVRAGVYLHAHNSGWREGMEFLLNKYPEYLSSSDQKTADSEGWFYEGSPFNDRSTMEYVMNNNVKWIELHGYFPFYGLYAPQQNEWCIIMNSDKVSYDEWYNGLCTKDNSYQKMSRAITLWHEHGIQVYLYLQCFEAWHQYARRYFARDIARNKHGDPLSAWKLCNLMNPDPNSSWGEYLIDQAEAIIDKYPDIDGIFYDRMDYWNYDHAHHDDITLQEGHYSYMLGFAQEKINDTLFSIFRQHKLGIWGNNPTSVEVCRNLGGIMAESDPVNLQRLQFLCLKRPFLFYPKDDTPIETEIKLKWSLVCGAFPSITHGGEECQKLDEKYQPLFDLLKKRTWVLTSNPITTPDRFKANIFQTPDNDYVAVIISPDKSQLVPHPFEYNIPLKINVSNGNKIKKVYLLSGDWTGVIDLDFAKQGDEISVLIPAHLSSSVIYLAQNEKFKNTIKTLPVNNYKSVSFAPVENIFIKSESGDTVDFYFTNNTYQKILFALQGTSAEGETWIQPLENVTLNNRETKVIPLTIGAKTDGDIKITVLHNNETVDKIFPFKVGLSHSSEDLFYDDFNSGMKKWTILRGKWIVSNGITQGSGSSHFAIVAEKQWQDYIFEVKTRIKGSDDPKVDWLKTYLYFRVQDSKNFYRFGVHGDGRVIDLYKCVNGKFKYITASSFLSKRYKWYTLRIHVDESHIIGYVNGNKIIEAHDTEFSKGGVGIGVLEDGMVCEYKDVVVKKL